MIKAILTYDYGEASIQALRDLGYEVTLIPEKEIVNNDLVNEAEVLICYTPFKTLDITKMPHLKYIQLSSIGFDQAPAEAIIDQNIVLCNNQGGYSKPMGEFVVGKLLEIYKRGRDIYNCQKKSQWHINTNLLELIGKNIMFFGTGTIAKESAKRLAGFEMNVYGANTTGHRADYFDECFTVDEAKARLDEMDVVVLTLPGTSITQGLVDHRFLSKMKEDAVLINVSRGSVIVEKDLIEVLSEGKFLGVALDVFEKEPLEKSSPLWSYPNVYISSHSSWISEKRNQRRFEMIYNNLINYKENKPMKNQVNIKRGY